MEGVPDLSALLKGKLQLLSKKPTGADVSESVEPRSVGEDVHIEPPAQPPKKKTTKKTNSKNIVSEDRQSVPVDENPSLEGTMPSAGSSKDLKKKKKKGGKKRSQEVSAGGREGDAVDPSETHLSDGEPEGRPKKKARSGSIETEAQPSEPFLETTRGERAPLLKLLPRKGRGARWAAPVSVARGGSQSDELTRQIRGGTKELPAIEDLYFKDEYIDAAFTRMRGDGSMNHLVEKYDSTLNTMIQLGASEKLAHTRLSAIERIRAEHKKADEKVAKEKEILRAKFKELEGKFRSGKAAKKKLVQEKASLEEALASLEREKTELYGETEAAVETLIKERQRLRDSRVQEVTRERVVVQTAMTDKAKRFFGRVRDHLAPERRSQRNGDPSGTEIPQEMIDVFAEQEKLYEAEVAKLRVGLLSESNLALSPQLLPSRFVNEEFISTLDPYGSKVGLIGSESASQLLISCEIVEDRSGEPAVDVTSAPTEQAVATEERSPEKDNPETGDVLIQEGGTETVGPEDLVLVFDTSFERREDEEEENDRGEKTPSPRPNEGEVTSEIEKGSTSSIPSLGADLLAPVPAQVGGPTVSTAVDPQYPPAPSVLTGNGNDQDSVALPSIHVDEEEEGDRAKKTPSPKLNEEETTSDIGKGSSSSIPSSNADLLVPVQVEGPILVHVPARVEDPIVSVAEDPEDPPAPSVLSGNEQDSAVSDTSSKGREDEEDEGDRAEKTPSPKPNEEETTSEIEKGSASSIPSSNADLLVPVPAQVEGPILVPVPARVEGRIVSVAEDTEDPPALSVLNGNKQDSAA
ncbi:hypothetical protein F2Q70_00017186 [Brassica cretica]|uniref:Uncharacterized protein n=1 Tax=Brassica cretica TaxID=69181 RepID=A0A8S9I147_BRACR|nr:hypothetical protein F2Q70_00017186 [Brassica cretica]